MTRDPDIQAEWRKVREGLAAMLRPYVQEQVLNDLVARAVAELLAGPGWRPPLHVPLPIVRQARITAAMAARDEESQP